MTVSRKGHAEEDIEFTKEDYILDKQMSQERTGYPVSDTEASQKAVDEKLPGGSQDY